MNTSAHISWSRLWCFSQPPGSSEKELLVQLITIQWSCCWDVAATTKVQYQLFWCTAALYTAFKQFSVFYYICFRCVTKYGFHPFRWITKYGICPLQYPGVQLLLFFICFNRCWALTLSSNSLLTFELKKCENWTKSSFLVQYFIVIIGICCMFSVCGLSAPFSCGDLFWKRSICRV